jgi:hypothetical protein
MTSVKIILSTLFAAISYGIIHDMITAHLCVEYFTIGHPKIIESESPVILALFAGIVGYVLADLEIIYLTPRFAELMDSSKHSKFLAAGWAHTSSYLSGIIGTILVCFIITKKRKKLLASTKSHGLNNHNR